MDGGLSISLLEDYDEGSLASSGFVAQQESGSEKWRIVSRAAEIREGIQTAAPGASGHSNSIQRARDRVLLWNEIANTSGTQVSVPVVLGCHTLKFKDKGVPYTMMTCVEFGQDGRPVKVTFRDGRY